MVNYEEGEVEEKEEESGDSEEDLDKEMADSEEEGGMEIENQREKVEINENAPR